MGRDRPRSRPPVDAGDPEKIETFMLAGDEEDDPALSRLEAGLIIGDIAAALRDQPVLYYRAALRAARLESQAATAELDARSAERRAVIMLRAAARDRPEPPSEEQIAARAQQHADVDKAERRVGELRRRLLAARALASAYRQRLRALEALGGLG